MVTRYQKKGLRRLFRRDAAFAKPELYEYLEQGKIGYAIRLPANQVIQEQIQPLLERPHEWPSREPIVSYHDFACQAQSWHLPRRVVAVSSALKKDRSEAEELLDQHVAALLGRIGKLEEEHGELRADLRQEVDSLEEAVRSGFEQLGVALPPRRISVRAKGIHFGLNTSVANVTVTGGSKIARFRQWIRRSARRVWEVVYGVPDDG